MQMQSKELKENLAGWGPKLLTDLVITNAFIIFMQMAEDLAQGLAPPGRLTWARLLR